MVRRVPCFRYRGNDFAAPLHPEEHATSGELIRCHARKRLVRLTPEEHVRQALVWFLTEGGHRSAILRESLRFAVEERSVDILGTFVGTPIGREFSPGVTTVVIETKRAERDVNEDVEQLKTYMRRERCRNGLLFNGRQAIWLSALASPPPEWTVEPLDDLSEVEKRIEQACLETGGWLRESAAAFDRAMTGDFNAFSSLVSTFGSDAGLTFNLSVRVNGSPRSVLAFSLAIDSADFISYRVRGVASRNRQRVSRAEFHSLLAIRPLT